MKFLLAVVAFGLAAAAVTGARATPDEINSVHSAAGLVETRQGGISDCGDDAVDGKCKVLYVNGRPLVHDYIVTITRVFPTYGPAQLVSVDTSTGGNACCFASYLIDISGSQPLVMKDFALGKDVFWTDGGVSFTSPMDNDELGDATSGLFSYKLATGKPRLLKRFPLYDHTSLQQKHYPSDVLSDPIVRKPILLAVGRKHFAQFRLYLAVAGNSSLKFVGERYVIGFGCMPHACIDSQGFFVIDRARKVAWCMEYDGSPYRPEEPHEIRLWGDMGGSDQVVRQAVADWFNELHLSMQDVKRIKVMPLPSDIERLYVEKSNVVPEMNKKLVGDTSGKVWLDPRMNPLRIRTLAPAQLFKVVAPSIYVVEVENADGEKLQGSAVSVAPFALLTNCHLVNNPKIITVARGGKRMKAFLTSEDRVSDRCILKPQDVVRDSVPIRSFASLEVGERVYSIGAPLGLELTLADGLLSGKRSELGERFIQTTAPISPGSSGGGLFDEKGNLIGITTFMFKESENLNFAIAADEFLRAN